MSAPVASSAWLGALTLVMAALVGPACAPQYPACRHDKHCKVQQGERCVEDVCQECKIDADCTDEGRPICEHFRCVSEFQPQPEAAAATTPVASSPAPCTGLGDCAGGWVCVEGTCGPCTDDAQCSAGVCDVHAGHCATMEPAALVSQMGADLTEVYRAWLLARWEIALQGNQQPQTYVPCRRGRHCRLRWDVDWQLFDHDSTEVHADPDLAMMLADGLSEDPSARLLLVGHAGADESSPDTIALARAERVRAWLVGEGLDGSRIRVRGEGSSRPVHVRSARHPGNSERRVEFLLSSDASPVGWWPLPRQGAGGGSAGGGSKGKPAKGKPPKSKPPTSKPIPGPAPAPTPGPSAPPPAAAPPPSPAPRAG